MKTHFLVVIVFMAVAMTALVARAAKQSPELAAQAVAEKWLTLLDEAKYKESWSGLASTFKKEVKKKTWISTVEELRKPMGKVISRTLFSAEFTKDIPGAPDGEYVVLKFETVFQNKSNVVETVTPMLESDLTWRISGYSVK